jgi:hypothetical protein
MSSGVPPIGAVDFNLMSRAEERPHQPVRPSWRCIACHQPWPCVPARRDLLLDLGWLRLAIYCGTLLQAAASDLTQATPAELWPRFVEWTRPIDGINDPRIARTSGLPKVPIPDARPLPQKDK